MNRENVLLIVNPVAGRKESKKIVRQIVTLLCRHEYRPIVYITGKKGDATDFVFENALEAKRIICCGGDGTLNEVLTGMQKLGRYIPVGFVPTGTTNDFARALRLPTTTHEAIENAVCGVVKGHDIGAFNDIRCFSYVASFGAFTKVSYSTPQWMKNLIGHAAYILGGVLDLGSFRSRHVKVIADGKEIEGNFVFGSVSNSTILAGLVKLPKADIFFDDGKFELMLIKAPKNRKELKAIVRSVRRKHYDERYIHYLKASKLSFCFEKGASWTLDGEFGGVHKEVIIENLNEAAQIIVPEK